MFSVARTARWLMDSSFTVLIVYITLVMFFMTIL